MLGNFQLGFLLAVDSAEYGLEHQRYDQGGNYTQ